MLNVICLKGGSEMKEIYKYSYVIALVLLVASFGEQASAQLGEPEVSVKELSCYIDKRTCYLEGDLYPNSLPSSINCKSDKSTFSFATYTDKVYSEAPLKCYDTESKEQRYFIEDFSTAEQCERFDDTKKEFVKVLSIDDYLKKQQYAYLDEKAPENSHEKVLHKTLSFEQYDRIEKWGKEASYTEEQLKNIEGTQLTEMKSNELHLSLNNEPVKHLENVTYYDGTERQALYHHSSKEETNLKFKFCGIKDVIIKGNLDLDKDMKGDIKFEAYSEINLVGRNGSVEKPTNVRPIDNCPNKECL